MMYKIFGKKGNKAFCYPVDDVKESVNNGYSFRDLKDNTFHCCSKDEIVENPIFTGKRCLGYQELLLA